MGPSVGIRNLWLNVKLTILTAYWRFWVRRQGGTAGRLGEPLGPELLRRAEQGLGERVAPLRIAVEAPLTRLRGQLSARLATRRALHAVAVSGYRHCIDLASGRQMPQGPGAGLILLFVLAGILEACLNYSAASGFLPESPIIVAAGAAILTLVVLGCSYSVGVALRRRSALPLVIALAGQLLGLAASGIGRAISYTTAAADAGLGRTPWAAIALVAIQVSIAAWATAKAYDACEPVPGFRKAWRRVRRTGATVQDTEQELAEQEARIARRIARIDAFHRQLHATMHSRYLVAQAKWGSRLARRSTTRALVPIACLVSALNGACTTPPPRAAPACVYLMLDRSASMKDYRLAREVIEGLPHVLRPGDRVTLSVVGALPLEDVRYPLDAAVQGNALEWALGTLGLSTRASEIRARRATDALRARLRGALDSVLREPAQQGSSLVDGMSMAARSECVATKWGSRVLVVLSDAQEQSAYVNLEKDVMEPEHLARAVAKAQARALGWQPSFAAWRVMFVGPRGRTASHWHELASFWRTYVSTLGGAVDPKSFGATPQAVLQAVADRTPARLDATRP